MGRSVTSAQRETAEEREWSFELDGETFTCVLRTDADAVLEWSEMAAGAGDDDLSTAVGAAFISRFFRVLIPPAEYARFRAHLRQHRTAVETLVEIMQAANEVMEAAVAADTGRPTEPPSRSSAGRTARADRTLQIISLPEGEYEFTDPPPKTAKHPRTPGGQRGGRRRQPA